MLEGHSLSARTTPVAYQGSRGSFLRSEAVLRAVGAAGGTSGMSQLSPVA
jgi:hypothetical protein